MTGQFTYITCERKRKPGTHPAEPTIDSFPFVLTLPRQGTSQSWQKKRKEQGPETQGNGRMACTDPGGWARRYDWRLAWQARQSAFKYSVRTKNLGFNTSRLTITICKAMLTSFIMNQPAVHQIIESTSRWQGYFHGLPPRRQNAPGTRLIVSYDLKYDLNYIYYNSWHALSNGLRGSVGRASH